MKKVSLVSLGCNKNLVDSEQILGLLHDDGYNITTDVEEADIIFINTCGFIEPSKKESIDKIFEMLSYGKEVVVTGCLAERYEKELKKEIPEAHFIPIHNYDEFNKFLQIVDPKIKRCDGIENFRMISTGDFSAYLKIGDGCDNCCSYCAIPLIRGRLVSRPYRDIISEANDLAKKGYKEIIVLEQDTTSYGKDLDDGNTIVTLLKALLDIKEFDYVRLLYLYPDEISDELIDLIAQEPRLTPYFDIPIQHSESHILKAMNRRSSKEELKALFNKIKEKIPNAVLRTTILVGFPGETEEDIDNLISFMEEISFDHLGVFSYSREEDTASYDMPNHIDEEVKQTRLDKVMKAQQKISYRQNKKHIGETMEGLVVGLENNQYLLRSYWNAPDDIDGKIFFSSNKEHYLGDKVKVKINNAFIYDLEGEEVN